MAKAKAKTVFFCKECGYETPKWMGQCPGCHQWNTMTEEKINPVSRGAGKRGNNLPHQQLTGLFEVSMEEEDRSSSGIPELDRVLGGGIVKGSLTLVGGDPGIGKSTLLLQICRYQANSGKKVVYVSGEESLKQIKMRAQRLGGFKENVFLLCETDINAAAEAVREAKPDMVVVDSVQTMYFSHFVGSDAQQFDAFTRKQIETFEKASMLLQEAFPYKILRHICNSAGIERFPGAQFDMVRLGIGLYGISPIDNSIMHNVSTLKTTILQIRDVPEEDTVGYSRKGHLTRPSRIAAIPIGYADGLNRHLGNGHAYCLVNGQRAPYVGNICMDVCMIDVTDIDCKEGDSVEIFGDHLPITVLSDVLGTIPYEVLTSVSTRVKRVYYQD